MGRDVANSSGDCRRDSAAGGPACSRWNGGSSRAAHCSATQWRRCAAQASRRHVSEHHAVVRQRAHEVMVDSGATVPHAAQLTTIPWPQSSPMSPLQPLTPADRRRKPGEVALPASSKAAAVAAYRKWKKVPPPLPGVLSSEGLAEAEYRGDLPLGRMGEPCAGLAAAAAGKEEGGVAARRGPSEAPPGVPKRAGAGSRSCERQ